MNVQNLFISKKKKEWPARSDQCAIILESPNQLYSFSIKFKLSFNLTD